MPHLCSWTLMVFCALHSLGLYWLDWLILAVTTAISLLQNTTCWLPVNVKVTGKWGVGGCDQQMVEQRSRCQRQGLKSRRLGGERCMLKHSSSLPTPVHGWLFAKCCLEQSQLSVNNLRVLNILTKPVAARTFPLQKLKDASLLVASWRTSEPKLNTSVGSYISRLLLWKDRHFPVIFTFPCYPGMLP